MAPSKTPPRRPAGRAAAACVLLLAAGAAAQSLPHPARTIYRCEVDGRTLLTDTPCLGARQLEVEPTRGLDTSTGRRRVGADVQRERQREEFADAVRPVTGMDARQLDLATRRLKLAPAARAACSALDAELPAAEQAERRADAQALPAAQQRLYTLRLAYRRHGCD